MKEKFNLIKMKKLVLFAFVICLGSTANATDFAQKNHYATEFINPGGFIKINSEELPAAVVESLIKDYPTSTLQQAYKNGKGKYKLIMVLKSGARRTVYIDSYGRWITMK